MSRAARRAWARSVTAGVVHDYGEPPVVGVVARCSDGHGRRVTYTWRNVRGEWRVRYATPAGRERDVSLARWREWTS